MRMRPKKNRTTRMNVVENYFAFFDNKDPENNEQIGDEQGTIDLNKTFSHITSYENKEYPLYLEIGCGKGNFITALSKRHDDCLIIGMEKVPDVILLAMEKANKEQCNNVRFVMGDADKIDEIFPHGSVDKLFLNFSDPWPKKRNAKRRLTYHTFLEKYKKILKPNGKIYFKTDNRPLFDFSIPEFKESGFVLENVCYDLHKSHLEKDNIHTEYEDNFSAKGFSINYLEAKPIDA